MGELLTREIDHKGGRPKEKRFHRATVSKTKLSDVGIDRIESHRYQQIASVPAEKFEEHIQETKGSDPPEGRSCNPK